MYYEMKEKFEKKYFNKDKKIFKKRFCQFGELEEEIKLCDLCARLFCDSGRAISG